MISLLHFIILLIIVLIISLIIVLFNLDLNKKQEFSNENSFVLNTSPYGFYSMLLSTVMNYYNFEKDNKNFKIELNNWIYKYKNGWTDYFERVDLKLNDDNDYKEIEWSCDNKTIKVSDLINTIPKIYKYNSELKTHINEIKNKLKLIDNEYDGLYIRRGDKITENELINDVEYFKLLIKKKPNLGTVFLQTDDYNVYLNIKKYIEENNYNITLLTICNENMKGAITNNDYKTQMLEKIDPNSKSRYTDIKPISEMSSEEKKEHMYELLTGVDILLHSNICIVDFETNVGRFIKLAHKNPRDVIDINNPDKDINYDKIVGCFSKDLY